MEVIKAKEKRREPWEPLHSKGKSKSLNKQRLAKMDTENVAEPEEWHGIQNKREFEEKEWAQSSISAPSGNDCHHPS
jgi:hypothetical protein